MTRDTGAIGSAIGDALKADGLRVVVIDRTGDVTADLSSESSVRTAAAEHPAGSGCERFDH